MTRLNITADLLERMLCPDYRMAYVQRWLEAMFVHHDRVWITGLLVVEGWRQGERDAAGKNTDIKR